MSYHRTNYEINEALGLGDLNDANDPNYVTAGSRVHYEVEAVLSVGDQFSPKQHAQAVADRLNSQPAFSYVQATFPDFYIFNGTLIVELTSTIDRGSIQDIAGNIRQEAMAVGFSALSGERINFISKIEQGTPAQPPVVGSAFGPTSSAGSSFSVNSLASGFGVSNTALLVAGGVIGLVLLISLMKR